MSYLKSFSVTLCRLLRSPLTWISSILLVIRYIFDAAGPDSWIEKSFANGWNTQFYNASTYKVYWFFFPIAFAVIVAADYIKDHKNRFACILRVSSGNKINMFLGRITAYITFGFIITFIGMYLGFAVYCITFGPSFSKGYGFLDVMARMFVHFISYSSSMVPFYTAFTLLFTAIFKSGLFGIVSMIIFNIAGLFTDFLSPTRFEMESMVEYLVPFARYFYPVHGAPYAIEIYLYAQDHPKEVGAVGFEHFATAFLCVTLCAVLMFIASYQFEKRFE